MLRGIRNTQGAGLGQLLNRARRLHQQIEQFEPMRIGRCLSDLRNHFVERRFRRTVESSCSLLINSIDLLNI